MDDQLMLDPASRRRWLLAQAQEIAPLGEALALAQAAEEFISGTAASIGDRTSAEAKGIPNFGTGAGPEAEATQLELLNTLSIGSNQRPFTNDQPLTTTETLDGLNSLVSLDDLIRYLREGGEVFAEDESADTLLTRANLKRMEQRLPSFALLPTHSTKVTRPDRAEKTAPPRPTLARARAEWAGSVFALPAT
jgi:hypothetical protein